MWRDGIGNEINAFMIALKPLDDGNLTLITFLFRSEERDKSERAMWREILLVEPILIPFLILELMKWNLSMKS